MKVKDFIKFYLDRIYYSINKKTPYSASFPFNAVEKWLKESQNNLPKQFSEKKICLIGVLNNFWDIIMIYLALFLKMQRYNIILVLGKNSYKNFKWLLKHLKLKIDLELINYEEINSENCNGIKYSDDDKNFFIKYNLTYKNKGEDLNQTGGYTNSSFNNLEKLFEQCWGKANCLFKTYNDVNKFIIPSGGILHSFCFLKIGDKLNKKILTIESWGYKPAKICWNFNGLAITDYDYFSHSKNLKWDDSKELWIKEYLEFQEKRSKSEKKIEINQYQNNSVNYIPKSLQEFINKHKKIVFLATNVVGDSATIGKKRVFANQFEWLGRVVNYIKDKNDIGLIIRIHPAENWMDTSVKLGEYSKKISTKLNNVYILNANDAVNSFALTSKINLVLTWVSTISADFVVRGQNVIIAGNAPYKDLGFVFAPHTEEEYFTLIESFLFSGKKTNDEQILQAKKYIYIHNKDRLININSKDFRNINDWSIDISDKEKFLTLIEK